MCIRLGFKFHEMHAHLRGSKSLLTLYQIINKPDFPSLADEIADSHPDMNIKVAAFTESEKSSKKKYISRKEKNGCLLSIVVISMISMLLLQVMSPAATGHRGRNGVTNTT